MNVTRPPQEFQPVSVILESPEELNILKAITGLNVSIPQKLHGLAGHTHSAVERFLADLSTQLKEYK